MSDTAPMPLPSARRAPVGAAAQQPRVTAALTRALMQEWARVGYAALSLGGCRQARRGRQGGALPPLALQAGDGV